MAESARPLGAWAKIRDPAERLRKALGEMYGFYRRTESTLSNVFRDDRVPELARTTTADEGVLFSPAR
jgi:hypothetical protein